MEALPLQKRKKRHGDTRLLTAQLWKYHLATKAPKSCGREKRKKNLCCCFGVLVFLHFFFLIPIQILVRNDFCFPQALGKGCHPRTEDGDSILQFSTAYLQSESVHSSFSSLKILKCLSFNTTAQCAGRHQFKVNWKVLIGICKNKKVSEATVGITSTPWSLIQQQECQCCIRTKTNTTRDLLLLKCGQVGPAV